MLNRLGPKLPGLLNLLSGLKINLQTFTTNGTYTPTQGMLFALAIGQAAGGGAGGMFGGTNYAACTGAGGSGAFGISLLTAAQIGTSKAVTVSNTGGTGGSTTGGTGGTGGNTSLGTLLVLTGGLGGTGQGAASQALGSTNPGGAGGTVTTATIGVNGIAGGNGFNGTSSSTGWLMSGSGANSILGFGGITQQVDFFNANQSLATGVAGTGYGSGGSGPLCNNSGTTAGTAGAAGAPGILIILEFCG